MQVASSEYPEEKARTNISIDDFYTLLIKSPAFNFTHMHSVKYRIHINLLKGEIFTIFTIESTTVKLTTQEKLNAY